MRRPTIVLPYTGPSEDPAIQDIFLLLRPEINGVFGERSILRIIGSQPEYKQRIRLVYFANIPNDVFTHSGHFEAYYAQKLHFAFNGKRAFSPDMQKQFSEFFNVDFDVTPILTPFEAQHALRIDSEELFNIWVEDSDNLSIYGQTIKRYQGHYIINYDMPALLRRARIQSDFAVMLFRMELPYEYFNDLSQKIWESLRNDGLVHEHRRLERSFHYSRSPFDQIRDALCFLYTAPETSATLPEISFSNFLLHKGMRDEQIKYFTMYPLVSIQNEIAQHEVSLWEEAKNRTFTQAYELLQQVISQPIIDKRIDVHKPHHVAHI